jgi:hypothetical protein
MTEVLQVLGQHEDAAQLFEKCANLLKNDDCLKPLFFEQAAYEYLHLG